MSATENDGHMMDNPLLQELGIRLAHWKEKECRFILDIDARHLNRQRNLQGGVVATLLDAACGYAGLYAAPSETEQHAATITLTINYIGKVREGRVQAIGKLIGAGRKIYFSSAELQNEDGKVIATAQGSFKRATFAAEA
ncbi:PaaI family thioesterase [Allopusillimonas ginsengisoli]|uniref:PaaI family thioesterase n=1 Tax=Allopusillimonas ginsengisoli TaxID=453575 RepID=UPI00269972B2